MNDWEMYCWDKGSKAVVACDGAGNGVVIWAVGGPLLFEMQEEGLYALEDLGLGDAIEGISIWEGTYEPGNVSVEYEEHFQSKAVGTFRLPTNEEWAAIKKNQCPWNDADFLRSVANFLRSITDTKEGK